MPELTPSEKAVIDVFKSAGFSGKVFPSEEACTRYLMEAPPAQGIDCPGYGRRINEEPCSWHRESGDPVCLGCDPLRFKIKETKHADRVHRLQKI